jgi:hypothetical protein
MTDQQLDAMLAALPKARAAALKDRQTKYMVWDRLLDLWVIRATDKAYIDARGHISYAHLRIHADDHTPDVRLRDRSKGRAGWL